MADWAGTGGLLSPGPVVNREYLRKDFLSFFIPWSLTLLAAAAISVWDVAGGEIVFTPVTFLSLSLFVIGFVLILVAHVNLPGH